MNPVPYPIKRQWRRFCRQLANGREDFWRGLANFIAPILWESSLSWRNMYYDYRSACWREARDAVSFSTFVYKRIRGHEL